MRSTLIVLGVFAALVSLNMGGCTIDVNFGDGNSADPNSRDPNSGGADNGAVTRLAHSVGTVQTADPREAHLPDELAAGGDTIVINADVHVIVNIEQDLEVVDLPDSTVVGFDNQTGYDLYIRFRADGDVQGVYVYDGDTLLLDYPCLSEIELLSEDDIDPFTGDVFDSFDLFEIYVNPDDFICGDALILPFEATEVDIVVEYIDLWP
jgi:hypothetical protein